MNGPQSAADLLRRSGWAVVYFAWLVGQILLSAWRVSRAMLSPRRTFQPGIVAVPVASTSRAELVLLASSITLTPGTITVETGYNEAGARVLFVHALLLDAPDALRSEIRDQMERRMLRFMRPAARPVAPPARGRA